MRLEINTINSIEASSLGNTISSLQKVLEHWLKKDYDYKKNGVPCWRMVCVAVKEGGGDPALADKIANEHPLSTTPIEEPTGKQLSSHTCMGAIHLTNAITLVSILYKNHDI